MTLTEAIQKVVDSKGELAMGATQIPGDCIIYDSLAGWRWQKSGAHPHFLHPSIMLGTWIVGNRNDDEFRL